MALEIPDEMLYKVEKPARYIGTELNSVHKRPEGVQIRFAFCFPDTYEVGMSHLGMKILYHLLNQRDDTFCERVFAPWIDMEEMMRKRGIPLFALESRDPIRNFDFVGFTLQYEMSYTNMINMLDLSGIPLRSAERGDRYPLVICGGPCAYNPEPLWNIADIFVLGEGEEVINEILDKYREWKGSGSGKKSFLESIAQVGGVYIPSFYDVDYNPDMTIKRFYPLAERYPSRISKRIIYHMDDSYFPKSMIVPYTDIVHDRIMLEVFRGCTRGCRFCQAGMVYRPVREKSASTLVGQADELIRSTGYDELSLTSLSICDYSDIDNLIYQLVEKHQREGVGVSLPSLRIDSFSVDLISEIQKVRKTGLTFAPEAGSQRMRDVINKGVSEEDLISSVSSAFKSGWSSIKLYFMIGLPTENYDDIAGIADMAYKVVAEYYKVPKDSRKRRLCVTVSTSSFVPKPFTPFQWDPQDSMDSLSAKQRFLQDRIRSRHIKYSYHDSPVSFLEAVFARGDRRLSDVLIQAWKNGCRFDGWSEMFNYQGWLDAFRKCGVDPNFYANRRREYDEILPWDHIDIGVSKDYLINESEKARRGELTHDCRLGCTGCGIKGGGLGEVCFDGSIRGKVL